MCSKKTCPKTRTTRLPAPSSRWSSPPVSGVRGPGTLARVIYRAHLRPYDNQHQGHRARRSPAAIPVFPLFRRPSNYASCTSANSERPNEGSTLTLPSYPPATRPSSHALTKVRFAQGPSDRLSRDVFAKTSRGRPNYRVRLPPPLSRRTSLIPQCRTPPNMLRPAASHVSGNGLLDLTARRL